MTTPENQVANLCRALDYYGETETDADMAFVRSPVDLPVFNMAVLLRPLEGKLALERRIAAGRSFFAARNTGWSFWICETLLDRSTARLLWDLFDVQGMSCIADTPGMEIEEIPAVGRALPSLDCRQATTMTALADFGGIVAESFNVPPSARDRLYCDPRRWPEGVRGWVGYRAGLPVSTAVTVEHAGVVGIYSVATQPHSRGHGYAEAIMRRAMEEARQRSGLTRFVLQSSPAGKSLYRKMGFRKISRFLVFSTPQ